MSSPASPMETPSAPAARFAALLHRLGVTHVVTVPDNTSAPILAALHAQGVGGEGEGAERRAIRVICATREGEGLGLASGLWLGGARPAVLIQNTGLLEAGDALRGTASRMGAPILLLVTCRGYPKARGQGIEPGKREVDRDILVRNDLDSVAHMTESTLDAWGIPFLPLRDSSDLTPVETGFARAYEEQRPVAVLLDATFT